MSFRSCRATVAPPLHSPALPCTPLHPCLPQFPLGSHLCNRCMSNSKQQAQQQLGMACVSVCCCASVCVSVCTCDVHTYMCKCACWKNETNSAAKRIVKRKEGKLGAEGGKGEQGRKGGREEGKGGRVKATKAGHKNLSSCKLVDFNL